MNYFEEYEAFKNPIGRKFRWISGPNYISTNLEKNIICVINKDATHVYYKYAGLYSTCSKPIDHFIRHAEAL